MPAMEKWFHPVPKSGWTRDDFQYLYQFRDTQVPYEFFLPANTNLESKNLRHQALLKAIISHLEGPPQPGFHRFNGPLTMFLWACEQPQLQSLYIAQAQIADLPKTLQDDLPIPQIVKEAGKGDIYDANLWMGTPHTYTPLHKDPNPNLFVQIFGTKKVRIFPPEVGRSIFQQVQQKIGQNSSAAFRGEEMMEGPERLALDEATWGPNAPEQGLYTYVHPRDALFIPKGWWHSIKSSATQDVTASANWWFR
jgi:hypothetical protein